ncbi:MAG: CRISPR-associated helicase Cas3', partial [Hyphomicrobiales bacterium]
LFEFEPRPLQKVVEEEVAPSTPRLVVVEAPMGEGKTEAALLLASRWAARGFRGGYVALPTQATANQIHQRTRQFLEKLFPGQPVNLQLVHGGLLFDDHGIDPAAVAGNYDPGSGDVEAAEWFLPRKRSLLGFWGVGTVDQALLAVLQVKHVFVRLFGLAGKPVIIDEVHAYDTYMTGLLERLLEWLAALGSPVVLLSATLPSGRRRQLFAAYERGQGHDASSDVSNASYPSLTWLDDAGVHARSFESKPVELGIDWLDDDLDAIGDFLERQLAAGGCAAVICNTVGRAQETYRALEGRFAGRIDLFHSRFRAKERHEIEERCRELFGPPGPGTRRPESYVLVATQVIEQSLDLDFDLMVTDFAPADLLLQRSGRLWRHKRSRPPGLSRTLYIRRPGLNEPGIPTFDAGTKAVYDEHILLRTWWALHERSSIAIPGDVQELIDFVYSEAGLPAEAGEALRAAWDETQRSLVEKQEAEREEARSRRLPFPLDYKALSQVLAFPVEEDQPDLHPRLQALTRLARPEIPVVALSADSSLLPLGTSKLDRELQRRLLEHSVSVGRADAVARLRQLEVPAVFAATPALRRHRVVVLDEDGRCDLGGGLVLAYDAELGLRILGPEAS